MNHLLVGELECSVIPAEHGAEGLKRLVLEGPFDLAVVDLSMPYMDGITLVKIARAVPALTQLPVVVLTGNSHEGVVRELLGLGVADYILKPIAREVALAKLRPFARTASLASCQ